MCFFERGTFGTRNSECGTLRTRNAELGRRKGGRQKLDLPQRGRRLQPKVGAAPGPTLGNVKKSGTNAKGAVAKRSICEVRTSVCDEPRVEEPQPRCGWAV